MTMASYDYDVIVIGSGAGGSVAAHLLAKEAKSVAVAEMAALGGQAANNGEVPRRALLHAAQLYHETQQASRFGIRSSTLGYNYPSLMAWKDLATERTGVAQSEHEFNKAGINVLHGRAHFLDPHTISIGPARFSAAQFIIATGSQPIVPATPGLAACGYLTPAEALQLPRPPKRLAILGSDKAGCELAQLFAILGCRVYLIEQATTLLPEETPEVGQLLNDVLSSDNGVTVLTATRVSKVEKLGDGRKLSLLRGNRQQGIAVDEIIVATGRQAALDIGLGNAGLDPASRFLAVNEYLQTTTAHIFGAGSCLGQQPTQLSIYQSQLAAHNMLYPRRRQVADYQAVTSCIFTSPQIAHVGPSHRSLHSKAGQYRHNSTPLKLVAAANITDENRGFIALTAEAKSGRLLAATIAAPGASDMIGELAVAIQNGLTAHQLATTPHAFTSWSEAIKVACSNLARS